MFSSPHGLAVYIAVLVGTAIASGRSGKRMNVFGSTSETAATRMGYGPQLP